MFRDYKTKKRNLFLPRKKPANIDKKKLQSRNVIQIDNLLQKLKQQQIRMKPTQKIELEEKTNTNL